MACDDLLNNGQPDACAREFLGGVRTREDAENLMHVPHVESCAVVLDMVDHLPVFPLRAHLDHGTFLFGRKFDRIGQKILPDLAQEARVGHGGGQVLDLKIHPARVFG